MIYIKILISIIVLVLSAALFKVAGDSLKLSRLNMISSVFYYMLIFNYIGGSLVFIGLRDHYLIQRVANYSTFNITYFAIAYCMIVFPLTLIIVKSFFKKKIIINEKNTFIQKKITIYPDQIRLQGVVLLIMVICTLATIYVFYHLGYIPALEMIRGGNLDALRQSGSRYFQGNQYIKNLLMLSLTPALSYFIYIYYRVTKNTTWLVFFIYMALLSVIVLTYDFSKSPIITYILGIYLIEVCLGKVKNNRKIIVLLIAAIALILFFYLIVSKVGRQLFSIYTGPVGRIIFTQIATLFLHVDAFPLQHAFLGGASFPGWMSFFIGNAQGLRSGRVVMEIYNAQGIENNTAGVMNTLFIGEAYANYGIVGIIIAPIVFGIVIGFFAYFLTRIQKRPTSVFLYVQITLLFLNIVEGGFVDIFYSASIIFVIIITVILDIIAGKMNSRLIVEEY